MWSSLLKRLRTRKQISGLRELAERSAHPYAAEIAATGRCVIINCRVSNATFNGRPIPDGEFGPQCDAIRENGAHVIAMDDHYVYCDDGERYKWRAPKRRGEGR